MKKQFCKLTLITNRKDIPLDEYLKFINICAASGITALQLREKNADYDFLIKFGAQLKKVLEPHNIPFIINDNIDLALELDADGVHLGQSDGDIMVARKILGPKKIIGASISSIENLKKANNLPIDYVGVGAVFKTTNKSDVATILGVEELAKLAALSKHPVIAIGGINETNASSVMSANVDGMAVIGAIHDAIDPMQTIKNLRDIINLRGENNV